MRNETKRAARNRGFTLIEILVVLGIVGLLAGILVFGVGGTGPSSKADANYAKLVKLQQAADLFVEKWGAIPAEWGSAGTTAMTEAQRQALIECLTGVYDDSGNAPLSTFSRSNPTWKQTGTSADEAVRFTAVITTNGGSAIAPRVVILQFRGEQVGVVVNGDKTVATNFLTDGAAVGTTDLFVGGAGWTAAAKSAWPNRS